MVSSPLKVVRSIHLTAWSNQAAWYCFLTDLLEDIEEARISIAEVLACIEEIQSKSKSMPLLRALIVWGKRVNFSLGFVAIDNFRELDFNNCTAYI